MIDIHVHGSWLIQIGAPPEVVDKIMEARQEFEAPQQRSTVSVSASPRDPELDQFMVKLLIYIEFEVGYFSKYTC